MAVDEQTPEVPPTRDVPIVTVVTLWIGVAQAFLGALTVPAILALHPLVGVVLACSVAVLGGVQAALKWYVQARVTASDDVVEVQKGGDVVAGPANDMVPPGAVVRPVGAPAAPDSPAPAVPDSPAAAAPPAVPDSPAAAPAPAAASAAAVPAPAAPAVPVQAPSRRARRALRRVLGS